MKLKGAMSSLNNSLTNSPNNSPNNPLNTKGKVIVRKATRALKKAPVKGSVKNGVKDSVKASVSSPSSYDAFKAMLETEQMGEMEAYDRELKRQELEYKVRQDIQTRQSVEMDLIQEQKENTYIYEGICSHDRESYQAFLDCNI